MSPVANARQKCADSAAAWHEQMQATCKANESVYFCAMKADRIKWNKRHAERKGHHPPDTYLMNWHHKLKSGHVLDIAGGRGRNAMYLASKGFKVLTADIAEVGLAVVADCAKIQNLPIDTWHIDLDEPQELIHRGPFDNIMIINFKPGKALLSMIPDLLVAGGCLLWSSFNDLQIEAFGFAPEKALYPNEFCSYFDALSLLDYHRFQDDSGHRDGYLFCKA